VNKDVFFRPAGGEKNSLTEDRVTPVTERFTSCKPDSPVAAWYVMELLPTCRRRNRLPDQWLH